MYPLTCGYLEGFTLRGYTPLTRETLLLSDWSSGVFGSTPDLIGFLLRAN